jgi:hypothetical protein
MRKVARGELVDYQTYGDRRDGIRQEVIEIKRVRRVHVGQYLTFLFENADTIRYQIQEMMRAERMVREADIEHELTTYNGLLGDAGELGCCLLVEIDDKAERERLLRAWLDLPERLYVRCSDGTLVRATHEAAQVGEEKISSVQYLKFKVGARLPVAVGCDHPDIATESALTDEQRAALTADLAS